MQPFPVLVVEDEPLLQDLLIAILEDLGFTVTAVATAERGVEVISTQPWRLVITDVQTPGTVDGWQLAWAAHACNPLMQVIVTSDYTTRRMDLLPPSALFVQKPWSITKLVSLVNRHTPPADGQTAFPAYKA